MIRRLLLLVRDLFDVRPNDARPLGRVAATRQLLYHSSQSRPLRNGSTRSTIEVSRRRSY